MGLAHERQAGSVSSLAPILFMCTLLIYRYFFSDGSYINVLRLVERALTRRRPEKSQFSSQYSDLKSAPICFTFHAAGGLPWAPHAGRFHG